MKPFLFHIVAVQFEVSNIPWFWLVITYEDYMCEDWIKSRCLFLSLSSQLICRLAVEDMSQSLAPLLSSLFLFFTFWSSEETFCIRTLIGNCTSVMSVRIKSVFTLYAVCLTITNVRIFQKTFSDMCFSYFSPLTLDSSLLNLPLMSHTFDLRS